MARQVTAGHEMLRATEHNTSARDFTHEVIAVDSEGNHLFDTESLFPDEVDTALDSYPEGKHAPDGVDHYEIVKK